MSTETPYQLLGGETGIRNLVERFYALMDEQPETYGIRKLHPADLEGSKQKLFMFLSGWLGGPRLYEEAYGHPRLRMRHLPFAIGVEERDQWMLCMNQVLDELSLEPLMRDQLKQAFQRTADHMRNQQTQ